jgi:RimJ/RimL family protein N-acetyltransferase
VIELDPWSADDLPLLEKLLGDPVMTEHLGGPEGHAQLVQRNARYSSLDGTTGWMFRVTLEPGSEAVGSVGYWEREWRGEVVYEIGWSVLPAFQGRGIATMATAAAIEKARSEGRHRHLHAFPSVDNVASNAVCRKLGFTLVGACDFEYPPGHPMKCNDWRLALIEA